MVTTVEAQIMIILGSIGSGIVLGLMFDWYRVIRGEKRGLRIIKHIQDILFWILCALIIFLILLKINFAYLSMYIYLIMGMSFYIYLVFFSKRILSINYQIVRGVAKTFRSIMRGIMHFFQVFTNKILRRDKIL